MQATAWLACQIASSITILISYHKGIAKPNEVVKVSVAKHVKSMLNYFEVMSETKKSNCGSNLCYSIRVLH